LIEIQSPQQEQDEYSRMRSVSDLKIIIFCFRIITDLILRHVIMCEKNKLTPRLEKLTWSLVAVGRAYAYAIFDRHLPNLIIV